MPGYRRRRPHHSPHRTVLPAAPLDRPVSIPVLSADQKECLRVAADGGGVVQADYEPVQVLAGLGLVSTLAWPGGEVRFVATPAGRRVAATLAAAPAAA